MLRNPKVVLLLVLALVAAAVFVVLNPLKFKPRLGLDLQGGTRLTLEAQPTHDVPVITPAVMDSLYFVIEKRVNQLGIGETMVQKSGDKRLIVEIPGVQDPEAAKKQLGQVGQLEFKVLSKTGPTAGQWLPSGVSGKDLSKADIGTDSMGKWLIQFSLNAKGSQKFGELTTQLAMGQQPLGIFFDGAMVSSPSVNEPILSGSGQITGSFTQAEAKALVDTLNAGALPVNIDIIEENTVGPLLGKASINKSLVAGGIAFALVACFMLVLYRSKGLVADVALIIYALLTYSLFVLFGVTFTLAGIAGFVLSVGMAVDANILIFERTKEELATGKPHHKAVTAGFDRAFPSIFDSNMTTTMTCLLLWLLGTGPVKGFAFTLAIGVAVSMFSAITVTRTFLELSGSEA